ncbi:hypothetical protein [Microbacterium sp. SLBN-111]|uniref:hypothetical protein n=1 Tax=Microbacterium sp. SLBN-111 TaxID=3377733 RepID=UPI003C7927D3
MRSGALSGQRPSIAGTALVPSPTLSAGLVPAPRLRQTVGRGRVRVVVVDAFGMPPQYLAPLPSGTRVTEVRSLVDPSGVRVLFALEATGVLRRLVPGQEDWDEVARGIRGYRADGDDGHEPGPEVVAESIPRRARPARVRTATLPNGRTAVYALGADARLYARGSTSRRWRVVRENVAAFDVLPHGAAVVASR